ncbi:MAG: antitoxin YezG family protein [Synergistaceae bacterium]|jgi:hypothetical protein|nr:antitoxin YezG family protein [Synergistaceae bacterium]
MTDIFQAIADALQAGLPADWNKICVYIELGDSYYEVTYYCFIDGMTEPIQCYKLPELYNITEEQIDSVASGIAAILKEARAKSDDKWSVATYVLTLDGKFKIDYDYTDLSGGSYNYKKQWKSQYLNVEQRS